MTDFQSMTVVFEAQTPEYYTESVTVPVIETFRQRVGRFFTRKDAPTYTYDSFRSRPFFHTLEVTDTDEAERFRDLFEILTDKRGYEIVSVVVEEKHTMTELVTGSSGNPSGAHVGQLLVAFDEEPYNVGGFVAATHEYGFGFADDLNEWMSDHYQGEHDSPAAYAENFYDDVEAHNVSGMPDWVEVDWAESADNLKYDVDYVEHPETLMTHVFWRH